MKALVINCSPVKTGATAEIVRIISRELAKKYETKSICIDDYNFSFCRGCRSCHRTAECIIKDDIPLIMKEYEQADIIVSAAPSYWADIPGQFKAFIDTDALPGVIPMSLILLSEKAKKATALHFAQVRLCMNVKVFSEALSIFTVILRLKPAADWDCAQ